MKRWGKVIAAVVFMALFFYGNNALTIGAAEPNESDVIDIVSNYQNTYLLKSDGTVWATGNNRDGQLGDGTEDNAAAFQQVPNLEDIVAIDAGYNFAIALKDDGTVWTWGYNFYGQLGTGDTVNRSIPTQVEALTDARAVAAGDSHSLAVTGEGTVWAWGYGFQGQLGLGDTSNKNMPTEVTGLSNMASVSASAVHSLAVSNDGTVWSWGQNIYGQLGNGTSQSETNPVQVTNLNNVKMVIAAYDKSFAVTHDGMVFSWGKNGTNGELGLGDTEHRKEPTPISGLSQIASISVEHDHVLALTTFGDVYAFGANSHGQLGTGNKIVRRTPIQVETLDGMTAVGAGQYHSFAVDGEGQVWAWGSSYAGALANGELSGDVLEPMITLQAGRMEGTVTDAAGDKLAGAKVFLHTNVATKQTTTDEDGRFVFSNVNPVLPNVQVLADGYQSVGVYDIPLTSGGTEIVNFKLVVDEGLAAGSWLDIKANNDHMIALKSDGTVWTRGINEFGQLGDGTNVTRNAWMKVPHLSDMIAVDLGEDFSLALSRDGEVWSWGNNEHGQLGHGDHTARFLPEKIEHAHLFTAIALGDRHALALDTEGNVWAWGENGQGQLGIGTNEDQYSPVNITALSDVDGIHAGGNFSAVVSSGDVFTWGANDDGQLGHGNTVASPVPVKVEDVSDVQLIDLSYNSVIVYTYDGEEGTVMGWGSNSSTKIRSGAGLTVQSPVVISSDVEPVAMVGAGDSFSILLLEDGSLYSWGSNIVGQLGFGDDSPSSAGSPTKATVMDNVINIGTGPSRTYAMRRDGSWWTWGANKNLMAFPGLMDTLWLPYKLPEPKDGQVLIQAEVSGIITDEADQPLEGVLVKATLAEGHTDALGEFSTYTGADGYYHLSLPPYTYQIFVVSPGYMVEGIPSIMFNSGENETFSFQLRTPDASTVELPTMAASNSHSLMIINHKVYAAGGNWSAQLGYEKYSYAPFFKAVDDLPVSAVSVAAGHEHSLALMSDGTVWAWGWNDSGQLGNGTFAEQFTPPFQIEELNEVKAIVAGAYHSLALKDDGTVWAWGNNWDGQLGDDTWENSAVPTPVQGLSQVIAIASGDYHSFALKEDGTVWAWGSNWDGQLGVGHTSYVEGPVQLPLTQIVQIEGGNGHTAAIDYQGRLWTWGSNTDGQLGYETAGSDQTSPQLVSALSNVKSISLGRDHSIALLSDGTVWGWGDTGNGQAGILPDGFVVKEPMQIEGLDGTEIATGDYHTLVRQSDGSVVSFGASWDGQLGSGLVGDAFPIPHQVQLYGKVTGKIVDEQGEPVAGALVTIASEHDAYSAVTDASGKFMIPFAPPERNDLFVQAEGYPTAMVRDLFIEGDEAVIQEITLTTLPTESNVPAIKQLASSHNFNLALMEDGTVLSWGDNSGGQLGTGTTEPRKVPQPMELADVKQIATGMYHGLALKEDGTVWAWGSNEYGQVGVDFGTSGLLEPIEMTALGDQVASVAASKYASYAVKSDGTVWAWGKGNALGDGIGYNTYIPVQVITTEELALTGVTKVSTSHEVVYAMTLTGDVYAWGYNNTGQYGNGTTSSSNYAVASSNLKGMSHIQGAVGYSNYSIGLKDDGTVWAWGRSTNGVFGEDHSFNQFTPIQIEGIPAIVDVGMAMSYVIAIDETGRVWAWGQDNSGYFGGDVFDRPAPQLIEGLSGIQRASAGSTHVLLQREDGSVWGWGNDLSWQLGLGSQFYVNAIVANPVLSGFTDRKSGRLAGLVKDDTGHPVINAELTVTNDTYSYHAATNAIGQYVFESIVPGQYEVTVHSGEVPQSTVVSIEGGLTTTQHFNSSGQTEIDVIAPVITLIGANLIELYVGEVYEELGYTVEDNYDPAPAVSITGQVNTQVAGEYMLTYTATDASGNSREVTRTVIVKKQPEQPDFELHIKEVLFIDIDPRPQFIAGQILWTAESTEQITGFIVSIADGEKEIIGSDLADLAPGDGIHRVTLPLDTSIPENAAYLVISARVGDFVKHTYIELIDTMSAAQFEAEIRKAVNPGPDRYDIKDVVRFMIYEVDLTGDGLFNRLDVEQLLQFIDPLSVGL